MQCNANVRTPELWTTALIFAEPQKEWEVRRMENYQTEEDDQCKILIPSRSREMGEMIVCAALSLFVSPHHTHYHIILTPALVQHIHWRICAMTIM